VTPTRRSQPRRRGSAGPTKPVDLWRAVPTPPELRPVVPTADPSAVLDSLGPPPLQAHTTSGQHYFASVVERAAMLANALAASAGLLADPDES